MPGNIKNASRKEQMMRPKPKPATHAEPKITSNMTEEEKLAAMFQAQNEAWAAQSENLAK